MESTTTNATGSTGQSREYVEPGEKFNATTPNTSASEVNTEFDPVVDEQPEMRDYARGNFNINDPAVSQEIPEQQFKFQAPPVGNNNPQQQQQQQGPKPEQKPVNPAMEELPKKEQEMATEYVCELVYQNYAMGKMWLNKQVMISEKRLNRMERKGEIDLSIPVPYGTGKVPASRLINAFNSEMEGVITMSPEFREKTEPVLKRVLMKRGIGLTDEQYLGIMVAQDLAQTFGLAMRGISQRGEMLNFLKESFKLHKAGQGAQGPTVNPTVTEPPKETAQKQTAQATPTAATSNANTSQVDNGDDVIVEEPQPVHTAPIINNPNTMFEEMNRRKAASHVASQSGPKKRGPKPGSKRSSGPPNSLGTGQPGRRKKEGEK